MSTIAVTQRDYIVAQQQRGRYTPHIFRSETHFRAWCDVHRPRYMVARTNARGRCLSAIDHRNQIDHAVDDREAELVGGDSDRRPVRGDSDRRPVRGDSDRRYPNKGEPPMSTVDELFPNKYLKGEDLKGHAATVRIVRVAPEKMRPDSRAAEETKHVVYFEGKQKGLILGSKTLFNQIVAATGEPDTDNWPGKAITIYPESMVVAKKPRVAIRARGANGTQPAPAVVDAGHDDEAEEEHESEVRRER